jgi:hypothetical protein
MGSVKRFLIFGLLGAFTMTDCASAPKTTPPVSLPSLLAEVRFPLTLPAPLSQGRKAHLSAASGLIKLGSRFFVVADDDAAVVEYSETGEFSQTHPIPWRKLPAKLAPRKKKKPDFESLFLLDEKQWAPGGALVAWPSFSTPERRKAAVFPLDPKTGQLSAPTLYDFDSLALPVEKLLSEPNFEGAVATSSSLVLLQRGNGAHGENGILRVPFADAESFFTQGGAGSTPVFTPIDIGTENGIPLGFTDAALLPDDTFLALASAENSASTYADGEVAGSALLQIRFESESTTVKRIARFTDKKKFEGLAAEWMGQSIRLWLVDDADDPEQASSVSTALLNPTQALDLQFLPR